MFKYVFCVFISGTNMSIEVLDLNNVREGEWIRITTEEYVDSTEAGDFRVVIDVFRLKENPEIVKIVVRMGNVKSDYLETEGVVILHYPSLMAITSYSYFGLDAKFIMRRFVKPVWQSIVRRLG